MKKMTVFLIICAVFAVVCAVIVYIQNRSFITVEYSVADSRIPPEFDGFCIAQVSDLHNRPLHNLADEVASHSPDVIVITGDLIGRNDRDISVALETSKKLCDIATVYFVSGNHEGDSELYDRLRQGLSEAGGRILENSGEAVTRGESEILICGVTDTVFDNPDEIPELNSEIASANAEKAVGGYDGFTVMLAHRPEHITEYEKAGADLVLSGHAHGGAYCLPFGKAIFAPGQGFFPEYASGINKLDSAHIVVSRGLGDSTVPFRINSPYELVICTLTAE